MSVDPVGQPANYDSGDASISGGGRFVAFASSASDLVAGDTNGVEDIFVRDREAGTTRRISVGPTGAEGNGGSRDPCISPDGRFVGYSSDAANLVAGDTNGHQDIFLRDIQRGATIRVSIGQGGRQANSASYNASISADGRIVAFETSGSNLVPGDTNDELDIFVRDLKTATTTRVNVALAGQQPNSSSSFHSISANGRLVAFHSDASNLIRGDTNGAQDIFVRDREAGTTFRVSVGAGGQQGNDSSVQPEISADGRTVAFTSYASNLVSGDTNGVEDIFVHQLAPSAAVARED